MAAGTATISEETYGSMKKIKWSWTAGSGSSAGTVSSAQTSYAYNGKIQALITVGATGSSAPSASYDITIKDESSVDVLMGTGASRAATTEYTKAASMAAVANDKLTLAVTSAGSANAGAVYLFIR